MVALLGLLFVRAIKIAALEEQIHHLQAKHEDTMKEWKKKHNLYQDDWKV